MLGMRRLEGAYAVGIIYGGQEEVRIGVGHSAALAVGFGEDEMFLGSDSLALAPLTRRIAYMEDGDCVVITPKGAEFMNFDGVPVERTIQLTAIAAGSIGKDGYRPYMENELHEHPLVIGQTLQRMVEPASRRVLLLVLPFDLANVPRAVFPAFGSSFL